MQKIYFISGPCGSGKTTFANAFAVHLVRQEHKTVYLIHGDDFHQGFIEPEDKGYFFVGGEAHNRILLEDILRFSPIIAIRAWLICLIPHLFQVKLYMKM